MVYKACKKTWFLPDGFSVSGNYYDQDSTFLRHLKDNFSSKYNQIM